MSKRNPDWEPVKVQNRLMSFKIRKQCILCHEWFFANHITREKCYKCTGHIKKNQCKATKVRGGRYKKSAEMGDYCTFHVICSIKKEKKERDEYGREL